MWGQLEEGSPGFRVPPAGDSGRAWGSDTRSSWPGIQGRLWRFLWHVQDPLPSNTSPQDPRRAGSLLPGLPTSPPVLQGPPGPWGERHLPGPCPVTQAAPRLPPSACNEPAGLQRVLPRCSRPRPPTLRPCCLQFQGDAAARDPSSAAPTRRGAPVLPAHSLHSCFLLL